MKNNNFKGIIFILLGMLELESERELREYEDELQKDSD